jgi:hypothetical protein
MPVGLSRRPFGSCENAVRGGCPAGRIAPSADGCVARGRALTLLDSYVHTASTLRRAIPRLGRPGRC